MAQVLIRARDHRDAGTNALVYRVGDVIDILEDGVYAGRKILSSPTDWTAPPIMEGDGIPRLCYIVDVPSMTRAQLLDYIAPALSTTVFDGDGLPVTEARRAWKVAHVKAQGQVRQQLLNTGRATVTDAQLGALKEPR